MARLGGRCRPTGQKEPASLLHYYAPAVYFAIRRQRAAKGLGRVSEWLIAHTRALEIAAGLVIGLPFLAKGLAAL